MKRRISKIVVKYPPRSLAFVLVGIFFSLVSIQLFSEEHPINQLFAEGALIARAIPVKIERRANPFNFSEYDAEFSFLGQKRTAEGNNKNVERSGQRSRSATLLVPGVEMPLISSVGILYNADKSTVRSYMYADSGTGFQYDHSGFYNPGNEKKKFAQVLSRSEFISKYRDFRSKIDNLSQNDRNKMIESGKNVPDPYNEVIGNFFPESVAGLVVDAPTAENKIKLLALRQHLESQGITDIPMVIMESGKVKVWTPSLKEIAELSKSFPSVMKKLNPKFEEMDPVEQKKAYVGLTKAMGFEVKDTLGTKLRSGLKMDWELGEKNLVPLSKSVADESNSSSSKPKTVLQKVGERIKASIKSIGNYQRKERSPVNSAVSGRDDSPEPLKAKQVRFAEAANNPPTKSGADQDSAGKLKKFEKTVPSEAAQQKVAQKIMGRKALLQADTGGDIPIRGKSGKPNPDKQIADKTAPNEIKNKLRKSIETAGDGGAPNAWVRKNPNTQAKESKPAAATLPTVSAPAARRATVSSPAARRASVSAPAARRATVSAAKAVAPRIGSKRVRK